MNVISLLLPKATVAYLYSDLTIRQGLEKFRRNGYTAVPVINREGRYQGCVGEGDFLWYLLDQDGNVYRDREKDLLERSLRQSFIPVIDDRGAFVGIVTRQNIIRKLTVLKTEAPIS